jgi:hypothetical protein
MAETFTKTYKRITIVNSGYKRTPSDKRNTNYKEKDFIL